MSQNIKWPSFTLGADPELILDYKGAHIDAYRLLGYDEDDEDDEYDSENEVYQPRMNFFGLDGCSSVAELRPHYSSTPMGLVKNIQDTMLAGVNRCPKLIEVNWLAGANKHEFPIGGHIHFGIDRSTWITCNLTAAMDIFVAIATMPLEISAESKRRKEEYGILGDVEIAPWGMEYRPLPSWIHSPTVALGILSLAKHVAYNFVLRHSGETPKTSTKADLYYKFLGESFHDIQSRYEAHDIRFFRKHFDSIWSEINSWPVAPDVAEGLEIIKTMLAQGYRYGFGDIKSKWGIVTKPLAVKN